MAAMSGMYEVVQQALVNHNQLLIDLRIANSLLQFN
jgi:hypothetical protein